MGVIYKILPEITNFIIEYKKNHPEASCRVLSLVVKERFAKNVSKSSINAIIKKANLSSKIGRRSFKPKPKLATATRPQPEIIPEIITKKAVKANGFYFLKAADIALGGCRDIAELTHQYFERQTLNELSLKITEIILPEISANQAKNPSLPASSLSLLSRKLALKLQEVYSYKITLENKTTFYIDAEFRSVWTSGNIPYEFSTNIDLARERIKEISQKDSNLVLLTTPTYLSTLTNLFLWIRYTSTEISLIGENNRPVFVLDESRFNLKNFLFGVLPHQYKRDVGIVSTAQTTNFIFKPTKENFIVTDCEIELLGQSAFEGKRLRLLSLKRAKDSSTLINLCTNITYQQADSGKIVELYLSHWPDSLFALADSEQKTELLSYALERRFPAYPTNTILQWENLRHFWRECLHIYCVRHFFPLGYEKLSYEQIKERFYNLSLEIEEERDYYRLKFLLPCDYAFRNDLLYAVRRVNEKCLSDINGKRLWFTAV